jgi:hypothetical protein
MPYYIEPVHSQREPVGEYRYRILNNGRLVAHYWHDNRGDDHGIEFVDGPKMDLPICRMVDFITGGGPQPLGLSADAVVFLDKQSNG